jgi:hypothetical protein
MIASVPNLTPHGHFRRWVEGSEISLEANTAAVPNNDRFYVLEAGEVRLDTSDFAAATALYQSLCVAYWELRLTSVDLPARLVAARGLFRHDREHPVAGELLVRHGDDRDRAHVKSARHRAAFMRRRGADKPAAP